MAKHRCFTKIEATRALATVIPGAICAASLISIVVFVSMPWYAELAAYLIGIPCSFLIIAICEYIFVEAKFLQGNSNGTANPTLE